MTKEKRLTPEGVRRRGSATTADQIAVLRRRS